MSKYNTQQLIKLVEQDSRPSMVAPITDFLLTHESALIEAPGSTRQAFHHAYAGGLLDHIIDTYSIACGIMKSMSELRGADGGCIPNDFIPTDWRASLLNVAIFHDLHKVFDPYQRPQYVSNVLKSGSISEAIPYKVSDEHMNWESTTVLETLSDSGDAGCKALTWGLASGELGIKNGGIKSLMVLAALAPDILDQLTDSEVRAIKYHGGAYETSKYELQGKEDALQIAFHSADMISSRSSSH